MKNKSLGEDVLSCLIEGNKRFQSGLRSVQSMATPEKLKVLAQNGQNPKCIILACSDSRVPAEMIFDQGLGDLFVIRVAGNVVAPSLIASMEFAAANFGSPLIMVLGHTRCGAIQAACSHKLKPQAAPSKNLEDLIKRLTPAADKCFQIDSENSSYIEATTRENVRNSIHEILKNSAIISNKFENGEISIVGAVFELDSGRVVIDDTPYSYFPEQIITSRANNATTSLA
ncbi:MAG: carbonic anhydrase [Proteobacteria bacterium]|nr:carbonic anhydrase [Pseudomonadota bacterium]